MIFFHQFQAFNLDTILSPGVQSGQPKAKAAGGFFDFLDHQPSLASENARCQSHAQSN